ncbi:MAG: hypothetical protein ACRDH2_16005 [Anaerolineales bacterium]
MPVLTCLAPSTRYYAGKARAHKKLTDWGRPMIVQGRRWLPERALGIVADSEFAAILWLFRLSQLPGQLCVSARRARKGDRARKASACRRWSSWRRIPKRAGNV